MGQYRIQSESLGVDFLVEGDEAPNERSTFEILKQVVPPDQMIKAYKGGNKDLARAAYKNGYFDQDSDTGLYDAFKQAAGEVFEGLGNISKEVSLDFTASGAMTYGVPGSQKLVEGARAEQQRRRKKRKATGYQLLAETYGGYKSIGDAGKMAFSKLVGEGDEDIDASIEFIGDMMTTQSFIDDGASIMAEKFGDIDMYNDLKMGRVEPDKKQALAGSLFVQLENPLAVLASGGIRSTTSLLRRGTAKKLAQDLQKAQSKQFLYSNQLNRLAADAPKNLVKTADDALQGATKEVNDILEKLNPYTKQKAKAGMTNQVVGKAMQGMGRAGEYVGNVTEFIRRAGIEEATTFLMKSGLSETAAKTVIFGSVGLATDMTDGEASLTGSGINALAAYLGPRAIASMGRSSAILGKQLTMAETSMPFFKRIGALPADNPKLAEVIVDRTDNLLLGDAASQLKPLLSQARELPTLVRNAARTIDRTGLGRVATGTANVAKAAVGGAALPGAFGYMIGGGEGAAAAIGASSPFIAGGLGYGSLLRYANKSDLIAKQLGDVEYHKQSLGERERADFEKLAKDQQVAVSTFSQFYPDAVIKVKSMGKDGPMGAHYVDGSDSIIEINADKNNSWSTILSHEIGHHVERHGLLPNILEELLGNPEKGKVGVFTQIDKSTGKPKITTDENGMKHYELNDEFRELQKTYIDKLANSNVSEKARQAYETPEQFARELFAEIVADRMITGKTSKRVGQSSIYKGTQKIIESLGDRITGGGFMRKAMHSLGMATNADGSLVKGTGILGKPFKSSKELDNLVKRYEDDTIGLSETEIREQRPVTTDDELDTVIVSPSDPIESLQVFNNGGHFKTDKDGNIKINPITKKPEVFSPSETRQANQALARDLIDSIEARENDLPEGHVTLSETADGKLTGSGKFIDDSIIDELSRTNRYNPSQINFLREASKAGREGIGNQMLLFYYAATGKGGRKYKSLKGGYRDSLVYGITITKDGNVILDTVSLDKLQKNIDFLLKRRGNEVGQAFGGSDPAVIRKNFESMFEKYLDNHAKGILNGDQNPQSGITDKQRDLLNAAFGPVSKAQIADNPTLSNLGERKANTLGTYRSRRLDRIGTMNPTGNTRNVVIDRIRRNLMPGSASSEGQRSFMPTEKGDGNNNLIPFPKAKSDPAPLPGVKRTFPQQDILDGLADKGLISYEAGKNNTVIAKVSPDGYPAPDYLTIYPDGSVEQAKPKLFMPASEAGAGKGKVAEAAKLWKEKGIDSPYFKKWFGKSKVVDDNGEPLVVRHGTQGKLEGNFFDPYRLGSSTGAKDAKKGFYFSDSRLTAEAYMGRDYKYTPQEKQRLEQLTKRNGALQSELENIRSTYSSPSDAVLASRQLRNEYSQNLAEMRSIDENVKTQKSGTLLDVYLNIEDPLTFDFKRNPYDEDTQSRIIDEALNSGNDGVIFKNMMDDPESRRVSDIYVAFTPEQIKSATGNRGTFDAGERNILFMPTQGDTTPASVQSWDGPNPTFGTNFTKGMVKDNKEAAALLRKSYEDQFGEPLRAQDFTEEQVNWLGDMFAKEGEAALGRTGNAVDWYTSAVERALAVAEEIFPDIGQKYEAKDRFLGALSITSQNMRVMDNAKGAVKQYQHKERTGKFDYSIKHGAKADAITQNLKLYDQAEAKMGAKDLHEFLDTDFTVKELSEWGKGFFGDKKFSIAGYSTDMVKGSAIFGPKIGQGFFQNLRGNYNPVTVDLWLRRTFGRLTGLALDTQLKPGDIGRLIYSVRKNVGKRKFSGLELPEFLKGVSITGKVQGNGVANFKISDQAYNRLFGDNTIGRDNYEAVYEFAGKLNKEWERRFATAGNDVTKAKKAIKAAKKEKKGTANLEKKLAKLEIEKEAIGKEKPQWAKAGSTVSDKLKPIDIPSNAERAVITKAFNVALKTLRDKGIDLTPADLQATLWYPEKDIWAFLKGENSDALNMSYDTAMEVIRDQR